MGILQDLFSDYDLLEEKKFKEALAKFKDVYQLKPANKIIKVLEYKESERYL